MNMFNRLLQGPVGRATATASLILAIIGCKGEQTDTPATDDFESRAALILSKMSLEEKVGQILQGDISTVTPEDVRTYHLGSVLNGGNSAPGGGVVADAEEWIALADAYWQASTDTSDGGIGIPVLWGTDAVHGHNNLQSATIFPHNSGLGAMRNPDLIRKIGAITAKEIRATGLDWTFAPTLAVAEDDRWGRAYESYSETPEIVAAYSKAMVEGLQGEKTDDDFLIDENVIATAKHFVADGGTYLGVDRGDARGDAEAILKKHGAGYPPAILSGVQTVMASFSSINGEKMHGSRRYLTDILRGKMGFTGFVVGDWNGHAFVDGCSPTDCLSALHAGIDMYMAPDSWKGLYKSLLAQAKSGEMDLKRLDEAVMRILTVKLRAGLFEAPMPSKRAATKIEHLGAPEHRAVARQAVAESLVLLKNDQGLLPLNAGMSVMVTGSGAHSMQQQTGGWTLSWQGDSNANDAFDTGETIFSGIQKAMAKAGGNATLSVDGRYKEKPDAIIMVYGEQPYAEYRGDRKDLVFEFAGDPALARLQSYRDAGIPVVSLFLTGRPLWVNPHINASDAFVVAWLPGTEAGGIADVIIGDDAGTPRADFKGKLSFSWPDQGDGAPLDATDSARVLFPYGYGLSYAEPGQNGGSLAALTEDPGVADIRRTFSGAILSRGDAAVPFQLYLFDDGTDLTPVIGLLGESANRTITTRGTDYQAQEDARILTWTGDLPSYATIRSDWPVDVSVMGELSTLSLDLTWRVDRAPQTPLFMGLDCVDGCEAKLDITRLVQSLPLGEWTQTSVPMRCFVEKGLRGENINNLLTLGTGSKAQLSLHSVALVDDAQKANGACPAP